MRQYTFSFKKENYVDKEMFEKGLKIRREVLGADYVDNAIASADDFNRPLQELVTQYCWGEIWGRPGLDRKTRSMLVIAITTALGRWEELRLHVRATRNTGVSRDEVKEVLLQAAVYAGVPAANTAFHHAAAVYREMDEEAGS